MEDKPKERFLRLVPDTVGADEIGYAPPTDAYVQADEWALANRDNIRESLIMAAALAQAELQKLLSNDEVLVNLEILVPIDETHHIMTGCWQFDAESAVHMKEYDD